MNRKRIFFAVRNALGDVHPAIARKALVFSTSLALVLGAQMAVAEGGCGADKKPIGENLIRNADFLASFAEPQNPGADLGFWTSGLLYTGFNQYPTDPLTNPVSAGVSAMSGTYKTDPIFDQGPFPGDTANDIAATQGWLAYNGTSDRTTATVTSPRLIWNQMVNDLDTNSSYVFFGYASNALAPQLQQNYGAPIVRFQANGQVLGSVTVCDGDVASTGNCSTATADIWQRFEYQLTPSTVQLALQLIDARTVPDSSGNDLAVTQLGLYKCVPIKIGLLSTSLDFGDIFIPNVTQGNVTLTNKGDRPFTIKAIELPAVDNMSNAFSRVLPPAAADCAVDKVLAVGDECTVPIRFDTSLFNVDTKTGEKTAKLSVAGADSAGQTATVTVDVRGVAAALPPKIEVIPSELVFATVAGTDGNQTFTVRNDGQQTLAISGVELSASPYFSFGALTCSDAKLVPGATCSVNVVFEPGADLLQKSATVTINSNDPAGARTVGLIGNVLAAAPPPVDSDGDGVPDDVEIAIGSDPNNPDTDGDGIPDGVEIGPDWANPLDCDSDGVPDVLEPNDVDTDGDGIANQCDPDDDGDGIPTIQEDANGDGKPWNDDFDGDGIPDYLENNRTDTDDDGIPNHQDPDDDGDGKPTSEERGPDYWRPWGSVDMNGKLSVNPNQADDGDRIPDYLDADETNRARMADGSGDSDGDGFSDLAECPSFPANCPDENNDGTPNYMQKPNPVRTGLDGGVRGGAMGLPLLSLLAGGLLFRRKRVETKPATARPKKGLLGLIGATVLAGAMSLGPVETAQAEPGQFYIGGGVGQSWLKPETSGTSFFVDDKNDTAYKLFFGYDLTKLFSIEAFYADMGESGIGSIAPQLPGTIGYKSYGAGVVLSYPNNGPGPSLLGKLGLAGIDNDSKTIPYEKVEDLQIYAGVGAEYQFNNGVSVRGEYEYIDKDARMATLNLIKRFGGKTAVAPVIVEPAPVVAAPPPPKPVTPEVVKRFTGILEGVNFEFDSDRLTPNAMSILDGVGAELSEYPYLNVVIVGHTCSIGTDAYNKTLSLNRAKSVARYLVGKNIDPARMRYAGMGEDQPIASNATEDGRIKNRRVEFIAHDGTPQ